MEFLSPILEVASRLWKCTSKRAAYVCELGGNLLTLKSKMEELNTLSENVKEYDKCTHLVEDWQSGVKDLRAAVEKILPKENQEVKKKCLGICPKNCWSSYNLGKTVIKKIDEVTKLIGEGKGFEIERCPCALVEERPMGKTVGLDLIFGNVQGCLQDEQVRRIGLFGLGGVGKTTLLKKINNEYLIRNSGDWLVIFIDLSISIEEIQEEILKRLGVPEDRWKSSSKSIIIEKIQEQILKRFGVPEDGWKSSSKEKKASLILNLLKAKKFLILLDEMWEPLDLVEVGIPPSNDQTMFKVILTTRSENVCDEMRVDRKFKVECLTSDEAFDLFWDNIGENCKSHPEVKRLAKIVVEECRGLPLALVIIAQSMSSRKTPQEWEDAIELLQSYPAEFSGMEKVFGVLKNSYDHLENSAFKPCFLHCSLLPEDDKFGEEDLINLWFAEGIWKECVDIHKARSKGKEIIRNLKLACLLESDVEKSRCKMHDLIRDMGRWLSCDRRDVKQKNFVVEYGELIEAPERWKDAELILLWHSNLKVLPPSLSFPNLRTFIMRKSGMKSLPLGFFQLMRTIRVLDLSDNGNLEKLHSEIFRLKRLEYLNISRTGIKKVPIQLQKLEKLKCLILDGMGELEAIPPNVISGLSKLQMFSMTDSAMGDQYGKCLQELERLPCLSEISISLYTISAVEIFLTSQKLQKCARCLMMEACQDLEMLELQLSTLQRLKVVRFVFCNDLEGVKINLPSEGGQISMSRPHISNSYFSKLVTVVIERCRFVNLTWLIYAQSLEDLWVIHCHNIKDVIAVDQGGESEIEEENPSIFPRLANLFLSSLPNLKSIYSRSLPFHSLVKIEVLHCPKLRKLPLNSNSATGTLKMIRGASSWWEELEWETGLKTTFDPYFQSS